MSDKRIKFLNTHVDNLTMEEAVEEARKLVRHAECGSYCKNRA